MRALAPNRALSRRRRLPVEDKGISLAYHYREAADEEAARVELEEVAESALLAGLEPRWGARCSRSVRASSADKGTAVQTLIERAKAARALYAGDDTTDLDAFRGLSEAGLEHAVRIAVASDEGPPKLDAADLVVSGPDELVEILRRL